MYLHCLKTVRTVQLILTDDLMELHFRYSKRLELSVLLRFGSFLTKSKFLKVKEWTKTPDFNKQYLKTTKKKKKKTFIEY